MEEKISDQLVVSLTELHEGTPGITPAWGSSLAEAAAFCFEIQGHTTPICMRIDGDYSILASLERENINDQIRRTWNDHPVATELGAYGVAALIIQPLCGLCVVERSKKGTGFDYWLGNPDDEPLFQGKVRMEVSGILKGSDSTIASRVKQKTNQTSPSDGRLPAIIIVVEFSRPLSRVVKKCKP